MTFDAHAELKIRANFMKIGHLLFDKHINERTNQPTDTTDHTTTWRSLSSLVSVVVCVRRVH